jgi:hypothetical protein
MGLTTPKGTKNVSEFNSVRHNQSTIDDFSTEDFSKKLMINTNTDDSTRNTCPLRVTTDFGNKYALLSGKNRVGRLIPTNK